MAQFSKLQIRAKVLSVISQLKSTKQMTEGLFSALVEELSLIEDRNSLFDIFVKEIIKMEEQYCVSSSFLLKELVPVDYIQEKVFELLKSSNYSDETKYNLVQLLRIVGASFDYNDLPQYFDNPQEVLDSDTKKLLDSASFNPESMLDFLDFVSAVSNSDRNILLQSLSADYNGDVLANIIYPILYSDFDDEFKLSIIDILSESKSSIAIAPFQYLITTSENEEIITACKKGLKKLKLAGATEDKAQAYFENMIKGTSIAEAFTTIPDGNGNQAILISRVNSSDEYSMAAIVINDEIGILDCFGFNNISRNELVRIITKFYQSEGKYKVNSHYVKKRIDDAIYLTIKNKRHFPYEFICWSSIIKDIKPANTTIEQEVINNIKTIKSTKDDVLSLLTKEYTFRWYLSASDNKNLNKLIDVIYNLDKKNISTINEKVKQYKDIIFNDEFSQVWKNRIINTVYLLLCSSKAKDAKIFYSIISDETLFDVFKLVLIQRSVFNSFATINESMSKPIVTVNIFRKKQVEECRFDVKVIEEIINLLSENWINE